VVFMMDTDIRVANLTYLQIGDALGIAQSTARLVR